MLESNLHQAAGLLGLGAVRGPRFVAMIHHGDARAELPLLWRLCATWLEMGLRVSVLDGSKAETAQDGGLLQALADGNWPGSSHAELDGWTILPSHAGLRQLGHMAQDGEDGLRTLASLMHQDQLLVLYGRVQDLGPLLCGYPIRPLLPLSAQRASVLSAYAALKQLLLNNRVQPTIVSVQDDGHGPNSGNVASIADNLRACAASFLEYQAQITPIAVGNVDHVVGADLEQLAYRLAEGALDVDAEGSLDQGLHPPVMEDLFLRGH